MQKTDKTVISLLASSLFSAPFEEDAVDWHEVYDECCQQAVPAIVAENVPKDLTAWANTAAMTVAQNVQAEYAHSQLHELLTEHQIPYVFLKGCASAWYYPNPSYRSMGDVDFLVDPSDVERVETLLQQNGFTKSRNDKAHHDEFKKDGMIYELHYAVNGVPEGEAEKTVSRYLEDTVETSVTISTACGPMRIPDDFHHGLVILLHTARHMIGSGLGLRHLCDWAVFVNRISDFPVLFEIPFRNMGLWTFACQLTALCCRYLSLPNQPWCGEWPEELMDAMILDILGSGNFGRKKENNREVWLVANVSAGGVSRRSLMGQMLHTMNDVTRMHWPAAKKNVVLLPIGWVFFGGRYLIRMAMGKRDKIHVGKMVSGAKERKELYAQYCLFETDANR